LRSLEIVIEGLEQELRALGDELDVELLAFADLGLDVLAPPWVRCVSQAVAIEADPPTAEPRIADIALSTAGSNVFPPSRETHRLAEARDP
jgi:hypothetical protein